MGCRAVIYRLWLSAIGYRLSDIPHLSAIIYRISAIGYRLSAIGYRLSAIGYPDIGYRLSANRRSAFVSLYIDVIATHSVVPVPTQPGLFSALALA
jgi:hypothetical protein